MSEPEFKRRPADVLMGMERARAVVPDALSFPRAAMRELVRGRWRVEKLRFELDADGRGEILYRLVGTGWAFHFFLVSDLLPEDKKTDRNFAAGWDAMGVLCQGEWTPDREALLRREVPRQRAGFADYGTLMYARGNRSTRIFNHVVDSLAQGRQPDLKELAPVGYILRTTAFIGNGQLGTLALDGYGTEHPLRRPFHAQFCSAFMLREYVFDLVDHLARVRNPHAARLAPEYRRFLGLGNSAATGLGAYATNHPQQMHRWSLVHEDALVEAVRSAPVLSGERAANFTSLLARAGRHFTEGARPDDGVFASPQDTALQLERLRDALQAPGLSGVNSIGEQIICLQSLIMWARANLHTEACEVLNSLILELHPGIAEAAVDSFFVDEESSVRPEGTVGELLGLIEREFDWAVLPDGAGGSHDAPAGEFYYFWYRASSAPRDVRRGVRRQLAHLEFETNMDFELQLGEVHRLLRTIAPARTLAGVMAERPDLRHAMARAQSLADAQYSSLRQPWLSRSYSPFEAIRFVLAFWGMEKFQAAFPKSVRGTFMQGAPIAEDVAAGRDGRWPYTLMPAAASAGEESELAPLPGNAGRSTAVTTGLPAPQPQRLKLAPKELARSVQTALQGHGMPLGVAEEAGALVAFSQHAGEPAVAAALRHCKENRVAPFALQALDSAQICSDGDLLILDAQGASALTTASVALDLAIERCLRPSGNYGAVFVGQAQDAWLARSIVLRAARQGVQSVVLWRSHTSNPPTSSGYAAAGPLNGDAWYADGPITGQGDGVAESLARSQSWLAQQEEGFLVACWRADGQAAADGTTSTACEMRLDSARTGVSISRTDYDALLEAGKALLVPQSVEHLILHEGADPLKSF